MASAPASDIAWVRETQTPPSPPPAHTAGLFAWIRQNFFSTWLNRGLTLLALGLLFLLLRALGLYLFWNAALLPLPTDKVELWWSEIDSAHQADLAAWQAEYDALEAQSDPEDPGDAARLRRLRSRAPDAPLVIPSRYWWGDFFSRPGAYLAPMHQDRSGLAIAGSLITEPLSFVGGERRAVDFHIPGVTTQASGQAFWHDCRARQNGICWPFIAKRLQQFMYGKHPPETFWRITSMTLLFSITLLAIALPVDKPRLRWRAVAGLAVAGAVAAAFALLPHVPWTRWIQAGLLLGGSAMLAAFPPSMRQQRLLGLCLLLVFPPLAGAFFLGGARSWLWVGIGLGLLVCGAAGFFALRGPALALWRRLAAILTYLGFILFLLRGHPLSLEQVAFQDWGGFFLTLNLAVVGITTSLPFGVVLALGRRSELPLVRTLSVAFIEFWRGVPLITVLFFAAFVLKLFLPPNIRDNVPQLMLIFFGIMLFSTAYMAEVVRGGLQAMPKGQQEAADSLGLNYRQSQQLIILPQALTLIIPGIVNNFIGLFKDTTLVSILGMSDFLGTVKKGFADPNWAVPNISTTGYIFVALVFFLFCYGMSVYSRRIEYVLSDSRKNNG